MTYNPSDHPRNPAGTPAGGQFAQKAGVGVDDDLAPFNNLFDYQHKDMVLCAALDGSEYYADVSQERADFASQHPHLTALVGNWQDYTFDQLRALNYGIEQGYNMEPVANPTQVSFETINAYTKALSDGANPTQVAYIATRWGDDAHLLLSLASEGAGDWMEHGFNTNQTRWVLAAQRVGVDVTAFGDDPETSMKHIAKLTRNRFLFGPRNNQIAPAYRQIGADSVKYGSDLVEPYSRIVERERNSRFL